MNVSPPRRRYDRVAGPRCHPPRASPRTPGVQSVVVVAPLDFTRGWLFQKNGDSVRKDGMMEIMEIFMRFLLGFFFWSTVDTGVKEVSIFCGSKKEVLCGSPPRNLFLAFGSWVWVVGILERERNIQKKIRTSFCLFCLHKYVCVPFLFKVLGCDQSIVGTLLLHQRGVITWQLSCQWPTLLASCSSRG